MFLKQLIAIIKNKYFVNASVLMIEKMIALPVTIFVGFYVARFLGPAYFGTYNYCISIVSIFSILASLGLENIAIRDLVKDEKSRNKILGSVFYMKLTASFLMLIVTIIIAFSQNDRLTAIVLGILAFDIVLSSFNPIEWYFQSQIQTKYVATVRFLSTIFISIYKLLLIYFDSSLILFAVSGIISSVFTIILNISFYKKKYETFLNWYFDIDYAKYLLLNSWPMVISGLVAVIYMRIDQVMITNMLEPKANGNYSAAVRISELMYFFPGTISTALLPWLVKTKEVSQTLYENRLSALFFTFFWTATLFAVFTAIFSTDLINFCYGSKYAGAADVFSIHIWTGVVVSLGLIMNKWIIAENLQRYEFMYLITGAVVNIILNYFFIPLWGINGAATATLISQVVANLVSPLFFRNTRWVVYTIFNSIVSFNIIKKLK